MTIQSILRKARVIVWGEQPETKLERKLLFKIDWFVLSYTCLAFWVVSIDSSNVGTAYVSGMKEDLNMSGNQYNWFYTIWTIGYVVGMIPNNIVLLKIEARWWFSICVAVFGLLTLGLYRVTSWKQILIIRFFQAAFEGVIFTGTHIILASWYTENELGKRSGIFCSSGLIGGLFSGFMQAQIYKSMNGRNGLAGWRWLFIIDFIITSFVFIYGLAFFPSGPDKCTNFYFTKEELELAKTRIPKSPKPNINYNVFVKAAKNWKCWLFSTLFIIGGANVSLQSTSMFALWPQWANYPIEQRNYYPMGPTAVAILANFSAGIYVDITKKYHHITYYVSSILLIAVILILVSPREAAPIFSAYMLSGFCYAVQPIFFAWANVCCKNDTELRVMTLACMNMFSNAWGAWWTIVFFGADTVPEIKKGCYAMLSSIIAQPICGFIIRRLQLREEKDKYNLEEGNGSVTNELLIVNTKGTSSSV